MARFRSTDRSRALLGHQFVCACVMLLAPFHTGAEETASISVSERIIYPYRHELTDAPDYAFKHYPMPTNNDFVHGVVDDKPLFHYIRMPKIQRESGVKNSFPLGFSIAEFQSEVRRLRKEHGRYFLGSGGGEIERGFASSLSAYPWSRVRERHFLGHERYIDAYAMIADYQMRFNHDHTSGNTKALGYVTATGTQLYAFYCHQIANALNRSASRQYGGPMVGRIDYTSTINYVDPIEHMVMRRKADLDKVTQMLVKMSGEEYAALSDEERAEILRNYGSGGHKHRLKVGLEAWRMFEEWQRDSKAKEAAKWDLNNGAVRGEDFSASLFFRLFYTLHAQNTPIALKTPNGGVSPILISETVTENGEESPVHRAMVEFKKEFVEKYPNIGGTHTYAACLIDYFSGWSQVERGFKVWDRMPYKEADYLLGSVLQAIYPEYDPGYENDKHEAENPDLHFSTPYGECVDVYNADLRPELMDLYSIVIAAGDLRAEIPLLREKVDAFMAQGGNFIVTAENAKRLYPKVFKGSELTTASGIGYYTNVTLPQEARVVNRCGGDPLLVEIPRGKGWLTLSTTPYGMEREDGEFPCRLMDHLRVAIEKKFEAQKLFSVGDGLTLNITRDESGRYFLFVMNPDYVQKSFKIESHIGTIESVEELPVDYAKYFTKYFPYYAYKGETRSRVGKSDATHIAGGDSRVFIVRVKERDVRVLDKIKYPAYPNDRFAATSMRGVKDRILLTPSFFQHFGGVKVDGADLLSTEIEWLRRISGWTKARHLRFLVDASEISDVGDLRSIIEKMAVLPHARDLIVTNPAKSLAPTAILQGIAIHTDLADSGLQVNEWPFENAAPAKAKLSPRPAKEDNKRHILMFHYLDDLPAYLAANDWFYDDFGGVCLEADYVFERSATLCDEEIGALIDNGYRVVVDFSRVNKIYRDVILDASRPLYAMGFAYYLNVLDKMKAVGVMDAIIYVKHLHPQLPDFIAEANKRGIRLHLHGVVDNASDLCATNPNVRFLQEVNASEGAAQAPANDRKTRRGKSKRGQEQATVAIAYDLLKFCDIDERSVLPVSSMPEKSREDVLEQVRDLTDKDVLFYAEYLSSKEILQDRDLMNCGAPHVSDRPLARKD